MHEKPLGRGPFKPALILHGGAGAITRSSLPPDSWDQYRTSLIKYLESTKRLLELGGNALDAACHAVSQFEDDPLFNCGKGSVFTEGGTIEMEASVMVSSVRPEGPTRGSIKRGAAVSLIRNTRHPIQLAREVLLDADSEDGLGGTATMHCHLSGREVEEWGWAKGLEKKPDAWFWTKKRWEEHRRGMREKSKTCNHPDEDLENIARSQDEENPDRFVPPQDSADALGSDVDNETNAASIPHNLPSQGTVGAVCMDSWGDLAVATSTGGLTNKKVGRIGDTPTIGAGFWAESWEELVPEEAPRNQSPVYWAHDMLNVLKSNTAELVNSCLSPLGIGFQLSLAAENNRLKSMAGNSYMMIPTPDAQGPKKAQRRAIAVSGTGNGDSFLRTNAARTVASLSRLSHPHPSLQEAIGAVAGPFGELQRSAGERWNKTGEGQGGIIGIELFDGPTTERDDGKWPEPLAGKVVFDFNCGGMFRAYYDTVRNGDEVKEMPVAMVFKEEY